MRQIPGLFSRYRNNRRYFDLFIHLRLVYLCGKTTSRDSAIVDLGNHLLRLTVFFCTPFSITKLFLSSPNGCSDGINIVIQLSVFQVLAQLLSFQVKVNTPIYFSR